MGLGKKLQNILKAKNMTVVDLSKSTGISSSTLYAIIRRDSDNVSLEAVRKISTALQIPLDTLIPKEEKIGDVFNYMFGDFLSPEDNVMDVHFTTDEFTPEEIAEIINYAEYLKSKRNIAAHADSPTTE